MADTYGYFLGTNGAEGFISLYDGYTRSGEMLYILKGGAGCGKSTFMKMLGARAEELGVETEYIWCSGDPDSLDGVRFPGLGVAFADGTAPHVLEPELTGVTASYIEMGRFYDESGLKGIRGELSGLSKSYKKRYAQAYCFLAAYGSVRRSVLKAVRTDECARAVQKRAEGIASREFGRRRASSPGNVTRRFLNAFTYQGEVSLSGSVFPRFERVYCIDNWLGNASVMIDTLCLKASACGHDVVLCPDPLLSGENAHLLVPGLSLAFISVRGSGDETRRAYRHVRLDAAAADALRCERAHIRTADKLCSALTDEARKYLCEAKALHDELESRYNPHVDFDGVYALVEQYVEKIFGNTSAESEK